ncbi:MAG: hypothetical protein FDW93_00740 [Bergeyella sp.]|nr:hypothetical protein [Bergeyella sp.]
MAKQRADSVVSYILDEYTTDPTHISWRENMEISYQKTDSVLSGHVNGLTERVGEEILYSWLRGVKPVKGGYTPEYIPSSRIFFTSGAAAGVNADDGQSGQRLALHHRDLSKLQAKFNKDNIPATGRYIMIESNMYQQLIDSLSQNQMAAFQATADLKKGILGTFAGFTLLQRGSVVAFNSKLEPLEVGQSLEKEDNLGTLAWQSDCVTKAIGATNFYTNINDALYYGDVFSAGVKIGGRARRQDWKGIAVILQKTA